MSADEMEEQRMQIYKKLGEKKLKEWSDGHNTKLSEFQDGVLVKAFTLFVRQTCDDGTAEVFSFLWDGFQAHKRNESTDEICQKLQEILGSGRVRILDLGAEQFDDSPNFKLLFDELCEKQKTSTGRKPCLDAFRNEVIEYRKAHKKSSTSPREWFAVHCSMF